MPFDIPLWVVAALTAFAVLLVILMLCMCIISGRITRAEERQELEQWYEKWTQAEE